MAVSTSTASRLPRISVEEIGDHFISLAPGGRSLVTTGIWALTKTSHCSRLVIGSPSRRSRILFSISLSNTRQAWQHSEPLDLGKTAIDKQFHARDVAAVIRCEKHHSLSNFVRLAKPAERDCAGYHLAS